MRPDRDVTNIRASGSARLLAGAWTMPALAVCLVAVSVAFAGCSLGTSGAALDPPTAALACSVGSDGLILLYDESADCWVRVASPTSRALHAVDFFDASHGWAVGDDGTVIVTADGGLTWRLVLGVDDASRLVGVAATGPGAARILGAGEEGGGRPFVLLTDDGGSTWRKVALAGGRGLGSDILFVDARQGWVALGGGPDRLLASRDGGSSWDAVPLGSGGWYEAVAERAGSVWAVGGTDYRQAPNIMTSRDQGGSWRAARIAAGPGAQGLYLEDVAFADERDGWAVSSVEAGLLLRSRDGGKTWQPEDYPSTGAGLLRVAAVGGGIAFVVTNGSAVIQTLDGGGSWTLSSVSSRHDGLNDVCAIRDGR